MLTTEATVESAVSVSNRSGEFSLLGYNTFTYKVREESAFCHPIQIRSAQLIVLVILRQAEDKLIFCLRKFWRCIIHRSIPS